MLKRVAKLPFVSSALQQASSVYLGVKGRYPLLGFVGGVAELGVRSASTAALQQAAPLLQNLETESECLYMASLTLKWHKPRKINGNQMLIVKTKLDKRNRYTART